MYTAPHDEHYFRVGLSAASAVDRALTHRTNPRVDSVLDLPCGHGRVARILRAKFPDAALTVCDIDRPGVDFCASEFNAKGIYSQNPFKGFDLGEKFDLIWVGSLVTHLNEALVIEFYEFLLRHLNAGGVAIVTNHGAYVAGKMSLAVRVDQQIYAMDKGSMDKMLRSYHGTGFGFNPYKGGTDYGTSISTEAWTRQRIRMAGGRTMEYLPHFWDNHQDVAIFGHGL